MEDEGFPLDPDGPEDGSWFPADLIRSALVFHGLLILGVTLITPRYPGSQGARASSHLDPRTNRPALMELRGCEALSACETGRITVEIPGPGSSRAPDSRAGDGDGRP